MIEQTEGIQCYALPIIHYNSELGSILHLPNSTYGAFFVKNCPYRGESDIINTMTNPTIPKLLFVYNADSTFAAWIRDGITKVFAPHRYPCNLCKITFGLLLMKKKWKRYTQNLPYRVEFLHRDEFKRRYYTDEELPAAFLAGNELSVLLTAEEINGLATEHSLIALMEAKIGR